MKKALLAVILFTGITKAQHACAQNKANKIFDVPNEKFRRQFTVELERGNTMDISLTSIHDLAYIANLDSVLKVFLADLALIKDSLPASSQSMYIDYNMDIATVKKMRVRKSIHEGSYYAFINGSAAILKMKQDTVVLHGTIPIKWLQQSNQYKEKYYGRYYFSVRFCLNDIDDLLSYKDGRLNEAIRTIQLHYKEHWQYTDDDRRQLKTHPEIKSNAAGGYIFRPQQFLLKKSVEVQNYKDHFIPSISATPTYTRQSDFVKRSVGISVEVHFAFEKPDSGSTQTHANLFTGIEYNAEQVVKDQRWAKIYPYISLAYLLHRTGNMYDKHSFRLAFGNFSFGNLTTRIQPGIYFNNFFKGITASLRIIQHF